MQLGMANLAAGVGYVMAMVETPQMDQRVETQLLYFRSVADCANIPIIISNRIGLNAGTIQALSAHPNICGVVEHSAGDAQIQRLSCFPVLWGAENSVWSALQAGASGAVLAFANAAPYATIALWEAHRTREEEAGLDWQSRISPPAEVVSVRFGIPGLKHAMDVNGYYGGPPRLPWTTPGPAAKREIESAFADLKT